MQAERFSLAVGERDRRREQGFQPVTDDRVQERAGLLRGKGLHLVFGNARRIHDGGDVARDQTVLYGRLEGAAECDKQVFDRSRAQRASRFRGGAGLHFLAGRLRSNELLIQECAYVLR